MSIESGLKEVFFDLVNSMHKLDETKKLPSTYLNKESRKYIEEILICTEKLANKSKELGLSKKVCQQEAQPEITEFMKKAFTVEYYLKSAAPKESELNSIISNELNSYFDESFIKNYRQKISDKEFIDKSNKSEFKYLLPSNLLSDEFTKSEFKKIPAALFSKYNLAESLKGLKRFDHSTQYDLFKSFIVDHEFILRCLEGSDDLAKMSNEWEPQEIQDFFRSTLYQKEPNPAFFNKASERITALKKYDLSRTDLIVYGLNFSDSAFNFMLKLLEMGKSPAEVEKFFKEYNVNSQEEEERAGTTLESRFELEYYSINQDAIYNAKLNDNDFDQLNSLNYDNLVYVLTNFKEAKVYIDAGISLNQLVSKNMHIELLEKILFPDELFEIWSEKTNKTDVVEFFNYISYVLTMCIRKELQLDPNDPIPGNTDINNMENILNNHFGNVFDDIQLR